MASMYHLLCDATHTISHIIEKDRDFEQDRSRYHYAALLIQRHWRGYLNRKEINRLHAFATIIQKWTRRYLCQIRLGDYMLNYLENIANRLYYKMATKIQAWYRGNWYRKHVLNFHAMYMERMRVNKINMEMIQRMKREKLLAAEVDRMQREMESKEMILFILFKLHHMLRTDQEGIYSIHNSSQYSWIEKLLKSIKFTDYMKALRKLYNETYQEPQEKKCVLKGRWKECEKAYYKRDIRNDTKPGPPINPNEFLHEKRLEKHLIIQSTIVLDFNEITTTGFCFDPHVMKKYESALLSKEEFVPRITKMLRIFNAELNISKHDFDVTQKMVELKSKIPAYYIDFWSRICEAHNFPTDL